MDHCYLSFKMNTEVVFEKTLYLIYKNGLDVEIPKEKGTTYKGTKLEQVHGPFWL